MNCLAILLSFTMHLGVQGDYNNIHPHLNCEKDSLIVGTYYNSERKLSYYIGKKYKINKWEIDTALVTGYHDNAIQPMIRFKRERFYIAPMYEKYYNDTNYGIVIGYEIKFIKI